MKRPSPKGACLSLLMLVGGLAFVATMITVVVAVGIWPGEAKLTAPLFCPDDRPDAFVVSDSYSVHPGETSYEFTLYCMGSRGEVTDVGFFRPLAVLTLGHALLIVAVIAALILVLRARRARRPPAGTIPEFPDPIVSTVTPDDAV